jgi:eukaryotic-like serine/threonine-protein kinase
MRLDQIKIWAIFIALSFFCISVVQGANENYKYNKNFNMINNSNSDISLTTDWWPMYQHDTSNTGFSPSDGPETNNVLWIFNANGTVNSPSVVNDKIYFGTNKEQNSPWSCSYVYCLDFYGKEIWTYETDGNLDSAPSIYKEKVYISDDTGNMYCFHDESGELIWQIAIGNQALSSPIPINGMILIGSKDGSIYCVNADTGILIWSKKIGYTIESTPAIVNDKVFLGNYCLNSTNGNIIWRSEIKLPLLSSPVLYDGKIYAGSNDEYIYCHNVTNGEFIWSYYTGSLIWKSSKAAGYGNLYIGTAFGFIYCVDTKTGEQIWSRKNSDRALYSPVVCDGKLYIGSLDGNLYCHDAYTGESIWNYQTSTSFANSMAIADNKLFAASGDELICFGTQLEYNADLKCTGSIKGLDIKPNSTIQGFFTVSNVGESNSKLDWMISSHPEWGKWTFDPSEGNDLEPDQGSITVEVTVQVPNNTKNTFTGKLHVINKENINDFEEIEISLTTNKYLNSFYKEFLKKHSFIQSFFKKWKIPIHTINHLDDCLVDTHYNLL